MKGILNKLVCNKNNESKIKENSVKKEQNKVKEINQKTLKKAFFFFSKYGNTQNQEQTNENSYNWNKLGIAKQLLRKKYCAKIEGIVLYLCRLMRPIWKKRLVNKKALNYEINGNILGYNRGEMEFFVNKLSQFIYWISNIYENDDK